MVLIISDDLFIFKENVFPGERMPLVDLKKIDAQEQMFRMHIFEFIKPRTENSNHPEECIRLLKGKFSRKLGITDPEINFFCYDNLEEYLIKKQEVENLPNYETVNIKTSYWQPRAAMNAYEAFLRKYGSNSSKESKPLPKSMKKEQSFIQKIFFGAPGTGKSFKVNSILPNEDILEVPGEIRKQMFLDSDTAKKAHYAEVLDNKEKFGDIWNVDELSVLEEKLSEVNSVDNVSNPEHSALQAYIKFLKEYKFERVFRTTFHPDYDYAQFVGAYKPKKEGEKITYAFVPQVFAKAYATAWKLYLKGDSRLRGNDNTDQVYLVIEEINRGNCAQIFGDIFQLLDRDDSGASQYSIDADNDFATWLKEESVLKDVWPNYVDKVGEGKLKLPPNLNILATMNTSDQSLFPMDSAFKRRFDWEYVPIRYAKDDSCGDSWNADLFKVVIDKDTSFSWLHFLKKVNADIYKATESEDKQMGEFFIKPKNGSNEIGLDEFRSKVLFYLWDSVYKDDPSFKNVFHFEKDGSVVTFQRLFAGDFTGILKQILKNLDEAYKDGEFKDLKILEG